MPFAKLWVCFARSRKEGFMKLPNTTLRRSLFMITTLAACAYLTGQAHAQVQKTPFMLLVGSYSNRAASNRAYENRQYYNRQYYNRREYEQQYQTQ